jgi:hypothetical protein
MAAPIASLVVLATCSGSGQLVTAFAHYISKRGARRSPWTTDESQGALRFSFRLVVSASWCASRALRPWSPWKSACRKPFGGFRATGCLCLDVPSRRPRWCSGVGLPGRPARAILSLGAGDLRAKRRRQGRPLKSTGSTRPSSKPACPTCVLPKSPYPGQPSLTRPEPEQQPSHKIFMPREKILWSPTLVAPAFVREAGVTSARLRSTRSRPTQACGARAGRRSQIVQLGHLVDARRDDPFRTRAIEPAKRVS